MTRPTLFGPMFKPENAIGGAVLVFVAVTSYYSAVHHWKQPWIAGAVFAAVPLFFALPGLPGSGRIRLRILLAVVILAALADVVFYLRSGAT